MYADDLCLIAPSRGAMQQLLSICEEFCYESCLSFNVKKSKALLFGKYDANLITRLRLNDEELDFVDSWKYLGCTIVSGAKFSFSTTSELAAFYASSNSILRSLRKPNELVLMNLLYSNCVPNLTYCAEIKDLSGAETNKYNVALNNCIRGIFSYNRWESTRQLRQQLHFPNISEIFASRRANFLRKCFESSNPVIRDISRTLMLL